MVDVLYTDTGTDMLTSAPLDHVGVTKDAATGVATILVDQEGTAQEESSSCYETLHCPMDVHICT